MLRRSRESPSKPDCRFNPHPPVGAGATNSPQTANSSCGQFQSSPARGGGCNSSTLCSREYQVSFQSSPARGGGCNRRRSSLRGYARRAGFNPHPPVGAGATSKRIVVIDAGHGWFQSSPARGGGCNNTDSQRHPVRLLSVSILTRPWGRVQLPYQLLGERCADVSILTRPWGRVQRGLENARERFPKRKCSSCQGVPCRALGG